MSSENIAFDFFDKDLPEETKEKMRIAFIEDDEKDEDSQEDEEEEEEEEDVGQNVGKKWFILQVPNIDKILANGLEQFVFSSTKNFFYKIPNSHSRPL